MNEALQVGFARIDITPTESVPLAGYGNTLTRLSQGVLDPLYATCIALTDAEDSTLLLFTLDMINAKDSFTPAAREAISQKYGIEKAHIVIAATHTHSSPDMDQAQYPPIARHNQWLIEALTDLAGQALADRKPAAMECARTRNEGMNFVRHYVLENDTVAGDNFGDFNSAPIRDHVSEADRQIQLVKLVREGGQDILLVNWQAHPTKASTRVTEYGLKHRPLISADYVGAMRSYVEQQTGMLVAYFQGACGNINSRSRITEENSSHDHVVYGRQLGDYVLGGLENMESLASGRVAAAAKVLDAKINHSQDHLLPQAQEIFARWKETNDYRLCADMGTPYGINSPYHAAAIIRKSKMGQEKPFELGAACAGGLGFAVLPYEVFDTNGMHIKETAPFDMTFILECANGAFSYIPSERGFAHGCYEADSCAHLPGTGEESAQTVLELLNELHKG